MEFIKPVLLVTVLCILMCNASPRDNIRNKVRKLSANIPGASALISRVGSRNAGNADDAGLEGDDVATATDADADDGGRKWRGRNRLRIPGLEALKDKVGRRGGRRGGRGGGDGEGGVVRGWVGSRVQGFRTARDNLAITVSETMRDVLANIPVTQIRDTALRAGFYFTDMLSRNVPITAVNELLTTSFGTPSQTVAALLNAQENPEDAETALQEIATNYASVVEIAGDEVKNFMKVLIGLRG